ncbi:MAG: hypothetical protein R3F30_12110 [Planctomycetota bacterium]
MNIVSIGVAVAGLTLLGWQDGGSTQPASKAPQGPHAGAVTTAGGQTGVKVDPRAAAKAWYEHFRQGGGTNDVTAAEAPKVAAVATDVALTDLARVQQDYDVLVRKLEACKLQQKDFESLIDTLRNQQKNVEIALREHPDGFDKEALAKFQGRHERIRALQDDLSNLIREQNGLIHEIAVNRVHHAEAGEPATVDVVMQEVQGQDGRKAHLAKLQAEVERLRAQLADLEAERKAIAKKGGDSAREQEIRVLEFLARQNEAKLDPRVVKLNKELAKQKELSPLERITVLKQLQDKEAEAQAQLKQWTEQKARWEKQWVAQQQAMKQQWADQQRAMQKQWAEVGRLGARSLTTQPLAAAPRPTGGNDTAAMTKELRGIRQEIKALRQLLEKYLAGRARGGSTGFLPGEPGARPDPFMRDPETGRRGRPDRGDRRPEAVEEIEEPEMLPEPPAPAAPEPARAPRPAGPRHPVRVPSEPGPAPAPAPGQSRDPLMPVHLEFQGIGTERRNS